LVTFLPVALAEPLLLTPIMAEGKGAALARELSRVTIDNKTYGHSGYFSVPAEHKPHLNNHIFFWYQPCLDGCDETKAPFLVWLQGGPGGPGTFGAMTEIGNWWVDDSIQPQERCFSWCKTNNCLFVDQPVEAGFSYQTDATGKAVTDMGKVDLTDTSPGAMKQVHGVVSQFLDMFPKLRSAPLYITGESYGGLYTPSLGVLLHADPHINFKALAVGDPVMNGQQQWLTYPDTLYGMGVIMTDEREQLRGIVQKGVQTLNEWQQGKATCRDAFNYWNAIWDDDGHDSGGATVGLFTNMTGSTMTEDILMTASPDSFDNLDKWFARPDIAAAFHITGYQDKQPKDKDLGLHVYDVFVDSGDFCTNSSYLYAQLLASNDIDLMIYSSTVDPLLGPPTTEGGVGAVMSDERTPRALATAYKNARKTLWTAGSSSTAGYAKCAKGSGKRFCYVVVRNAGHMTPAFAPRASYEMFYRFVQGLSFDKAGDNHVSLPQCAQCGGAGPFAGKALPQCNKKMK